MVTSNVHLVATCHCGRHEFTASINGTRTPIGSHICNCNRCRQLTGNLYAATMTWPGWSENAPDLTSLSSHDFSDNVRVYFCADCGAHMLFHTHTGNTKLSMFTGVIEKADDLITIDRHIWAGDTIDGGVADWIYEVDGRAVTRHACNYDKDEPQARPIIKQLPHSSSSFDENDVLEASCLCGGIAFQVLRPHKTLSNPPTELAFWQETNNRFYTSICACHDCRASTGALFQAFAFVPTACIKQKDGELYKPGMGTSKPYQASEQAKRYFCSGCGAFAFFEHDDLMLNGETGLLGVGVGLLQSKAGAKANDWLFWGASCVHLGDDANHRPLIEALKRGLLSWGKAAYGNDSIALSEKSMHGIYQKSIRASKASG